MPDDDENDASRPPTEQYQLHNIDHPPQQPQPLSTIQDHDDLPTAERDGSPDEEDQDQQPKREARRPLKNSEWESHKSEITRLYVDEEKPLADVVRIMRDKGFDASEKQYKVRFKKWDLRKRRVQAQSYGSSLASPPPEHRSDAGRLQTLADAAAVSTGRFRHSYGPVHIRDDARVITGNIFGPGPQSSHVFATPLQTGLDQGRVSQNPIDQSVADTQKLNLQHQQDNETKNRPPNSRNRKNFPCHKCPPGEKSFSTINDLSRHQKTVHGVVSAGDLIWRCRIPGCPAGNKAWLRLDNFKQHVMRMHGRGHNAEKMSELYDPDMHGGIEVGGRDEKVAAENSQAITSVDHEQHDQIRDNYYYAFPRQSLPQRRTSTNRIGNSKADDLQVIDSGFEPAGPSWSMHLGRHYQSNMSHQLRRRRSPPPSLSPSPSLTGQKRSYSAALQASRSHSISENTFNPEETIEASNTVHSPFSSIARPPAYSTLLREITEAEAVVEEKWKQLAELMRSSGQARAYHERRIRLLQGQLERLKMEAGIEGHDNAMEYG